MLGAIFKERSGILCHHQPVSGVNRRKFVIPARRAALPARLK
jgi:hypothetical protein